MKDLLVLLAHLLTTIAKLLGPGGTEAVVADSLLMKQPLLVISRSRRRSPKLSSLDRFMFGFWSLFLDQRRLRRAAVVIRPSTLLRFHDLLKKRKYQLLYSSGQKQKPGPKALSQELIQAIVELKQRNPRFGCRRIARQIANAFDMHAGDVDGVVLCRLFNNAVSTRGIPRYLSSDNDPLFRYHGRQANLRILDVEKIKALPYIPLSHPFVERLIGTIRREYIDPTPFWNTKDLEQKLEDFRQYYNAIGCIRHSVVKRPLPSAVKLKCNPKNFVTIPGAHTVVGFFRHSWPHELGIRHTHAWPATMVCLAT